MLATNSTLKVFRCSRLAVQFDGEPHRKGDKRGTKDMYSNGSSEGFTQPELI